MRGETLLRVETNYWNTKYLELLLLLTSVSVTVAVIFLERSYLATLGANALFTTLPLGAKLLQWNKHEKVSNNVKNEEMKRIFGDEMLNDSVSKCMCVFISLVQKQNLPACALFYQLPHKICSSKKVTEVASHSRVLMNNQTLFHQLPRIRNSLFHPIHPWIYFP